MRRHALPVLLALLAAAGLPAIAGRDDVSESRDLSESIPLDRAADTLVVVENVFGPVRVTTHDAPTVELTAVETIRARSRADLERAREEVGLRTSRDDGRIAFEVRRLDDDCDCDGRWGRWDGYVVEYDIRLRVPADVALEVATVNDGTVEVDGVRGEVSASNVNGPVRLRGLEAAGSISTVNGEIEASFARAPQGDLSVTTVNGKVVVGFPTGLSADLVFRTMHGEVWTDFPATSLALDPVRERTREGGRTIVRAESRSGIRIGGGGPVYTFETLNGDIYIQETTRTGARRTER